MLETGVNEIKVLIVDDEESPVHELMDSFSVRRIPGISFIVHSAKSVEEFQTFVRTDSVPDVLIADLKLTEDKGVECGVDEVISWQMILNPESIVIVHSAFPCEGRDKIDLEDLDPTAEAVDICVRAMRAGACACYKKSEDSADYVVDQVIREVESRRSHEVGFDVAWWNSHRSDLESNYGGRAIAVRGQQVIADGDTVPELRDKLRQVVLQGALPTILLIPSGDE